jgi:hypothetical protein
MRGGKPICAVSRLDYTTPARDRERRPGSGAIGLSKKLFIRVWISVSGARYQVRLVSAMRNLFTKLRGTQHVHAG